MIYGLYCEEEVRFDLEQIILELEKKHQFKIGFHFEAASKILPESNLLELRSGKQVPYDVLSVNIGSRTRESTKINISCDFCISTRPISQLETKLQQREAYLKEHNLTPEVIVCGVNSSSRGSLPSIKQNHGSIGSYLLNSTAQSILYGASSLPF